MLNNLEDVKLFIEWCKAHKVKVFKSEKIEFELSEISFVENLEINDSFDSIFTNTHFLDSN